MCIRDRVWLAPAGARPAGHARSPAGAGDGDVARPVADVARQPRLDARRQRRQRQDARARAPRHRADAARSHRAALSRPRLRRGQARGLARPRAARLRHVMQLYIGNKNYSSWSLRPWLLMKHAGIAFEEKRLRLEWEDGSTFKTTLLAIAPSGRVPLLVDEGFAVWDSLAIAEYLAERFADKRLWSSDTKARARARSICAEMHSGFSELRSTFGMNIEASLPEVGERM